LQAGSFRIVFSIIAWVLPRDPERPADSNRIGHMSVGNAERPPNPIEIIEREQQAKTPGFFSRPCVTSIWHKLSLRRKKQRPWALRT
jgi:hypothetical protein